MSWTGGQTFPFLKERFVPKLITGKTSEEMSQPVSHIKQSKQGCGSMLEKNTGKDVDEGILPP